MKFEIKQASIDDTNKLMEIGRTTFARSFMDQNAQSNMKAYMDEAFSFEQTMKELSHPNSLFFLVENEGESVGYMKLNYEDAQKENQHDDSLEIQRIYILNEYQGHGLGQKLMDLAFSKAIELGKQSVWLGVWEENKAAIKFYQRNGFVEFDKHIFMLGDDAQTDLLMKRGV